MKNADDNDEKFAAARRGLEQIAQALDSRKFPGRAWTGGRSRSPGPVPWKIAAALGALAAGIILVLHFWPAHGSASSSGHRAPALATGQPRPVPLALPKIVLLEDADSYSIIDLHGSVPVICFASRRSPGFEFITPIFGERTPAAATQNSHL